MFKFLFEILVLPDNFIQIILSPFDVGFLFSTTAKGTHRRPCTAGVGGTEHLATEQSAHQSCADRQHARHATLLVLLLLHLDLVFGTTDSILQRAKFRSVFFGQLLFGFVALFGDRLLQSHLEVAHLFARRAVHFQFFTFVNGQGLLAI